MGAVDYPFPAVIAAAKTRSEMRITRERLVVERLSELGAQIIELAKAHGRISTCPCLTEIGGLSSPLYAPVKTGRLLMPAKAGGVSLGFHEWSLRLAGAQAPPWIKLTIYRARIASVSQIAGFLPPMFL